MDNSSDLSPGRFIGSEEESLDQSQKKPFKLLKTCSSVSCVPKYGFRYLSDDILSVLVSYFTMNDLPKLSLVWRQWLDLWIYTPVLIFLPMGSMHSNKKFVKWVNKSLERHKGRYLKEFKVVCCLDCHWKEDIDKWLEFALSKNVERLELNFLMPAIRDARDKQLETCYYCTPERFLQSDLLKCMKSLSLKNLVVSNESIDYFVNNCPFLERLELVSIHFFFTKLVISGPNLALKYLQIRDCCSFELLSITNAPNLVSLEISSIGDGLILTDLPMLVEVSITGTFLTDTKPLKKSLTLSRLGSRLLSQIESLTLEGLESEDIINLHYLSQMTKLKQLVVEVLAEDDERLTMFIPIIVSCPRLEVFELRLDLLDRERSTRNIYSIEGGGCSSPQSNSLKVFEFLGYNGRASDVELTLQVVESAVCLKKIIIDPRIKARLKLPQYYEDDEDWEARSLTIDQIEALRMTRCIPPHVDVIIR